MLRPIVLIGAVACAYGKCQNVTMNDVINKTGFLLECMDKGWGGSYLRRRPATPLELKKKQQGKFVEITTLPYSVATEKAVFCPDAYVLTSMAPSWTLMMTLALSEPTEKLPYGSKANFKLAPKTYYLQPGIPFFDMEKTGDVDTMHLTCDGGKVQKTITPEGVDSFHAGIEYYEWRNRLETDKEEMQLYTKLKGPPLPLLDPRKGLDETRKVIALHRGEARRTDAGVAEPVQFLKRS